MFATLGIPVPQLQFIVFVGIMTIVIGYILFAFWQQIAIGLAAIGCLYVFCMNDGTTTKQETVVKVEEVSADKKDFMMDCLAMTDYTKVQCENIWEDRPNEKFEVKGN